MTSGTSEDVRPHELLVNPYTCPRPCDWRLEFRKERPLDVEIGFGHGDFLIRTALEAPDRNYVGIEQEWERVKRTLNKIKDQRKRLKNGVALENVRLLKLDASVALERLFGLRSIHRVYCLFPCPWPKKKHVKFRLFSDEFFSLLNSRLIDRGEVLLVTDSLPYFEWVLNELKGQGFRKKIREIPARFDTKYERKWQRAGQTKFYELQLVKQQHKNNKVMEDVALRTFFAKSFDPRKFEFEGVTGTLAVVLKEFISDEKREKAVVSVIVSEENITQPLWISIGKNRKGWRVAKADGYPVIPTKGVAEAIRLVYQAVEKSGK